jgi:hypothetical protein
MADLAGRSLQGTATGTADAGTGYLLSAALCAGVDAATITVRTGGAGGLVQRRLIRQRTVPLPGSMPGENANSPFMSSWLPHRIRSESPFPRRYSAFHRSMPATRNHISTIRPTT